MVVVVLVVVVVVGVVRMVEEVEGAGVEEAVVVEEKAEVGVTAGAAVGDVGLEVRMCWPHL